MKTIKTAKVKSFLSLLLVLMIIISAMPLSGISVFAATSDDFEYEILEDGTAEITGYSGWGGNDLIIPSNIDGYIVSSIGVEAFSFKTTITSITIPDTVTQIKQQAFMNCYSLSDIKLSSNLIGIGAFAFLGCAFDCIELPESLKNINSYAFGMCVNLNSIKIPANVVEIGTSAFSDCISLEKITVDTKNENYCDIDGVLFSKDKTMLIAFPNLFSDSYEIPDTVTCVSNSAFSSCNNLVSISIPDSVKEIGFQAFYGCSALKNVQMSDGLEVIGESAFENCSALNSIVIPGGVKEISSASFSNCTALENVQISDGVEIIGEAAFADCNSLNNLNIPSSVEEIRERALVRCTSLEKSL